MQVKQYNDFIAQEDEMNHYRNHMNAAVFETSGNEIMYARLNRCKLCNLNVKT